RCRKTWIEKDVELQLACGPRKLRLFPQNAPGSRCSAHILRLPAKICLLRNQILSCFQIRKNKISVSRIDARQRREQFAQINLGSPDAAGDQVESVNADTGHYWATRA